MDPIIIILITLVAAALVSVAQYKFKLGTRRKFKLNADGLMDLLLRRDIIIGVGIYGVSLVIYLVALAQGQLSFVYPTFASSFIFIMLISKYVFHEEFGWKRYMGMLLILVGILIISMTY